jgi:hypothetical protein
VTAPPGSDTLGLPGGATGPDKSTMAGSTSAEIEVYDPELAAYNAYLARLNPEGREPRPVARAEGAPPAE